MKEDKAFKQKIKIMDKLFESGCRTERELMALGFEEILGIPGITIPEMTIITELQKNVKKGKLWSYLGGESNEPKEEPEPAHHLE